MSEEWNVFGVDTVHLSFKTGGDLGTGDRILGLGDILDQIGVIGDFTQRNRGRHGFEHGISFPAGLEVDWTDPSGTGPNRGFLSIQLKGALFEDLGALEVGVLLLSLHEMGPHKCSRIDVQGTSTETPLVQELIPDFRAGRLAVKRKPAFEPKGQELVGGMYPKGATICLGSRQSESFLRLYQKDLECGYGPSRVRFEPEFKGKTAQGVWDEFIRVLSGQAVANVPGLEAEARLSQGLVRHYMPLRDVSAWAPDRRPRDWASTAPEPDWWAALFDQTAVKARRQKGVTKSLAQAFLHSQRQGGGRVTQELVLERIRCVKEGWDPETTEEIAALRVGSRYAAHASEQRLQELLENLPEDDRAMARAFWAEAGQMGGSQIEVDRDLHGLNPPM